MDGYLRYHRVKVDLVDVCAVHQRRSPPSLIRRRSGTAMMLFPRLAKSSILPVMHEPQLHDFEQGLSMRWMTSCDFVE
jgi:hypothetical protein